MGVALPPEINHQMRKRAWFDKVQSILRETLPAAIRDDFNVVRDDPGDVTLLLVCSVANQSQATLLRFMQHTLYPNLVAKLGNGFAAKFEDIKLIVRDTGAVSAAEAHASSITSGEPQKPQAPSRTRTPAQIANGETHIAQLRNMGFYRASANNARRKSA